MNSSEPPPTTGLVAGKYQLVRLIGRGGMGSVWEARNVAIGTRTAIKFIEAEYAESAEARSRFIKEARAAATIESKHLIRVHDLGETDDGKPFIVMELLEGEPLDKRIERTGRISIEETSRILQQVCRGLARAHDAGIVHRDLKPENIFLTRSPDDDHDVAKVLDFGIAKIQVQNSPHAASVSSSTKTGAVLGTPFYMSPEQARGLRNVDHRTDLWSLGVIAFKCLTGKLPFDGESVGDLLVKICTAPVPVPSQVDPSLPPSFDAWFLRALEREPDRRFQSAQDLAAQLSVAAWVAASAPTFVGTPMSSAATVAAAPGRTQMVSSPMNMGAQTPPPHVAAMTPPPGGMTASPFTAPVPGVPSPGRGKVIVLAAVAGLLVAGVGTGVALKLTKKTEHAVGIAPRPPSSSTPVATTEKLPDPTPAPTAPKPPDPKPGVATAVKLPTTGATKPPNSGKPAPSAKEAPPPASASASAPKPTPLPPPGTSKPRVDPGY